MTECTQSSFEFEPHFRRAVVADFRGGTMTSDAGALLLLLDLFLESHTKAPEQVVLDLDVTDTPLHGRQEGRFFHGFHDEYCYLPLYVFCGDQLLVALRVRDAAGAWPGLPGPYVSCEVQFGQRIALIGIADWQ